MADNTSDALGPDPVVGFEDEALKIMERLIGKPKRLDVISIVGMPGLGKTTIALKVYNDPCIAHQFYIRAFISVSQVYNKRDLLLGILRSSHINTTQRDLNKMSDEELKEELYKRLKGKRYLIVFDDIWNIEAWDGLKRSFPDDNNGSRIMFTSRIRDVALRANSIPHDLRFLSRDESWDLFHEKVFHKEKCPPELMEVGKNIAESCRGLPLAIVIVGGLLAKTEKTIHWWTQVGKSIASYLVSDSNQTTKTLELSYNHLPAYLKPLFLYFGAFPEDYEISVSKLIWLWVAEGFIDIEKSGAETVEDVAEGYLMDLIERSLILIAYRNSIGGVKSCRIHDLLHDLCLRKAEEENFMLTIHRYKHFSSIISSSSSSSSSSSPIGNKLNRLSTTSFDSFLDFFPFEEYRNIYSLLVFDKTRLLSDFDFQFFKLIRVLDFRREFSYDLPSGIGQLVHLRYLALKSISFLRFDFRLRNLETLIIEDGPATSVDNDIFQLAKLRHFHIGTFETVNWDYSNLLVELQTMSTPTFTGTNCAILRTTPNLRKLRCLCAVSCRELELLVKLEKLHMRRDVGLLNPSKPFDLFDLPTSLKQITLSEFRFDWKDISKLARLPNLEVLKLDKAFKGKLWDTNLLESDFQPFPKLKLLKFKSLDIVQWNASMDHFPSLQRLVLNMCFKLKEIPSDLGDIVTLEKIEVNWSCHTLAYSARKILEEQRDKGNEQLEIFIYPPDL